MLWYDLPSPYEGGSLPAFNLLKQLGRKHDITLLSFQGVISEASYDYNLSQYCRVITSRIRISTTHVKRLAYAMKTTLSPRNLLSRNPGFFNLYHSSEMQERLRELLSSERFDVIYTSGPTAHYVRKVNLPKIVHVFDCESDASHQAYINAKKLSEKLYWWLAYIREKYYDERRVLKKFDACIVVSPEEQGALKLVCPAINTMVIPNGVDIEYFNPKHGVDEWPSLLFVGSMLSPSNKAAVLYFHSQIYTRIKESLPQVKLCIVGSNPPKEIQALSLDKSIVVTGFVEDVRPYLERASVVIAPFISGTGIKNKVLEAMAMGKPVVSTSIGICGIEASPGKDIIIADEPEEFAKQIVKLLMDAPLRQTIGYSARKLVETSYSWQKAAEQLDSVFQQVVNK